MCLSHFQSLNRLLGGCVPLLSLQAKAEIDQLMSDIDLNGDGCASFQSSFQQSCQATLFFVVLSLFRVCSPMQTWQSIARGGNAVDKLGRRV